MDKDVMARYAPLAVVIIGLIFQWNLFVTPEKLEIKHRQVLMDVASMYTTKEQHNDLKEEINDMKKKIDKIYEIVTKKQKGAKMRGFPKHLNTKQDYLNCLEKFPAETKAELRGYDR